MIDTCKPDAVLLEATGLADPIAVAQLVAGKELGECLYLGHVWCIVDGPNFSKVKNLTRVIHQIRVADTVVINKTDKMTAPVESIADEIRKLNPFAEINPVSYSAIDLSAMMRLPAETVAEQRIGENAAFESCGRPADLKSAVNRRTLPVDHADMMKFLSSLQDSTARMKGYVRLADGRVCAVQSCFGDLSCSFVNTYNGPTELIAIGPNISEENFTGEFERLTKR
jgi:G3E family GTPase